MPVKGIGIMSGSSLDGLDMALFSFDTTQDPVNWQLLEAQTVPYSEAWSHDLTSAHLLSGYQLMQLDAEFGLHIGRQVRTWLDQHGLEADFIASHGHTIYHDPGAGFTTQIGSGAHITAASGLDTITTFRSADVAAGGQGAPFAPVADRYLFPGYDGYLNLGGIANVSVRSYDGTWKAWDIGPCNQALNHLSAKLGHAYDADGKIAAGGTPNNQLAATLRDMFPYQEGKPKGLSNAEVHAAWLQFLDRQNDRTEDLLATVTLAISRMIANHMTPLLPHSSRILVTGGGAYHKTLTSQLSDTLSQQGIRLEIPDRDIIDFKECALMAYLGYLTLEGIPYPVMDITGARQDTIGGAIHKAVK